MHDIIDNRFAGKKSQSFDVFLLLSSAAILFVAFGLPILINKTIDSTGLLIASMIVTPTLVLFLWAWIDTSYMIRNTIKSEMRSLRLVNPNCRDKDD